jgi:hypothetical protein
MENQDIINLYKSGMSKYAIAKKFGATTGKIHSVLRTNKIPLRKTNKNKKYVCDDNYFSKIDSHEKAYWLGFLTADGSVSKDDNEISIGLSYRDIEHLEKFKVAIRSDSKIYIYDSIVKGNTHKCSKFCFYSAQMKIDLAYHNVVPNKSETLKISTKIPKQFTNSYLLGIIDGDGSFYIDPDGQMHFSLIGSKSEIESIQSIIVAKCKVSKNKIQQEKRSEQMWYLNYGGNAVVNRIVNYLYKSSPIYLKRKHDIINNLLGAYTKRKPGRQAYQDC